MKLDNLRTKQLTFEDTFVYLKEVLSCNSKNFIKLFCLWLLFAVAISLVSKYMSDYLVALSFLFLYVILYLFYLTFIDQSYAAIEHNNKEISFSLKEVSRGFIERKGLDLLELIPIAIVVLLIVFFPSHILAIPLAFLIAVFTLILVSYTILFQPIVVIKKLSVIPAVNYSIRIIIGYFSFTLCLIVVLALACMLLYVPAFFIKMSAFLHEFYVLSVAGVEVLLFAVMLTIVYINLEIAWSIGFKKYIPPQEELPVDKHEPTHEFTEFFNTVPEVQIESKSNHDDSEEE